MHITGTKCGKSIHSNWNFLDWTCLVFYCLAVNYLINSHYTTRAASVLKQLANSGYWIYNCALQLYLRWIISFKTRNDPNLFLKFLMS